MVIVVFGSLLLAVLLRNRWEKTWVTVTFTCLLLTYFIGILNGLEYITWLKCGLMLSIISGYIYLLRKMGIKEGLCALQRRCTLGMLSFLLVSLGMGILLRNHVILEWDDMNHWGTVIKQIYYQKAIPTGGNSVSNYSDYQPIGALGIYWFLGDLSMYQEQLIFPIYQLLIGTCFLPFWEVLSDGKKSYTKVIFSSMICLFLPFFFAYYSLLSLKIDSFVAALYVLICIVIWHIGKQICADNKKDSICILDIYVVASGIGVLILSKSVGIYLGIVAIVCLLIISICNRHKKGMVTTAGCGIFGGMCYISWEIFCKIHGNHSGISAGFSKISLEDYRNTITRLINNLDSFWQFNQMVDDGSKDYIVNHYLYALCNWPVTLISELEMPNSLSLVEILLLILAGSIIFKYVMNEKEYHKNYIIILIVMFSGGFVYIIGHLSMYLTMFSPGEAACLSSFSRYLLMFFAGIIGLVIYITYRYMILNENSGRIGLLGLTIVLCMMCNLQAVSTLLFQYPSGVVAEWYQIRTEAEAIAQNVREYVGDNTYLWMGENEDYRTVNMLRYLLVPAKQEQAIYLDTINDESLNSTLEKTNAKYWIVQDNREVYDEIYMEEEIVKCFEVSSKENNKTKSYKLARKRE